MPCPTSSSSSAIVSVSALKKGHVKIINLIYEISIILCALCMCNKRLGASYNLDFSKRIIMGYVRM